MKSASFNPFKPSIILGFLFFFCISFTGKAQYYTIPDPDFAQWLTENYPSCMVGNQLDTTCIAVTSATSVNIEQQIAPNPIHNLDGIQYFTSLQYLVFINGQLEVIPEFPDQLIHISLYNNQLIEIPPLPTTLTLFSCNLSQLVALPAFHEGLTSIECAGNQLTSIPDLPSTLQYFSCGDNQLTSLPVLPNSIVELGCGYNQLITLPTLPSSLETLYCHGNQLIELPELPNSLTYLACGENLFTSLPALPPNLTMLNCNIGELTSLPTNLPATLQYGLFQFNQLRCLDTLPELDNTLLVFSITDNPFTCVPNHTSYTSEFPLCFENDPWNNPYECSPSIGSGIAGKIYVDQDYDCTIDLSEQAVSNIPIELYSASGDLLALTFTDTWGNYFFPNSSSNYHIVVDTAQQAFSTSCSSDTLLFIPNSVIDSVDFMLDCNLPSDLGIASIVDDGFVFPGEIHRLSVYAGNVLANYPFGCLDSIGGTLTFTITGPVEFESLPAGAIIPTQIDGLTFSYDIANFSEIAYFNAFELDLIVDTTAQIDDLICVTASISIYANDPDSLNNTLEYCYTISNSYDPNKKEVYPFRVEPEYNDYLTYTIHFQNTGTAPAINIRLKDLLDPNLIPTTFELMRASHPVTPMLTDHSLVFLFKDIMLADSLSNEPESHGFVQFRIKPVSGLINGTSIPNTASIYFDYNDPIVTNTAITHFQYDLSHLSTNAIENNVPIIYPNPSSGLYQVKFTGSIGEIKVFNLAGERILEQENEGNNAIIDLSNQPAGVYLLKMNQADQTNYVRLVKL